MVNRLWIICKDNKIICMKDDPVDAAITAKECGADKILQCIVESMFSNLDKLNLEGSYQ